MTATDSVRVKASSRLDPFPDSVGVFVGGAGAEHRGGWIRARDLERRYEAYCMDQARELLNLAPREAVRPMLRAAHEWAEGAPALRADTDPMELLVLFARSLLPLPPLLVWLEDLRRAPLRHLERTLPVGADDIRRTPVAVSSRSLALGPQRWSAVLLVFPEDGAVGWRGFAAFGEREDQLVHRTADIFREETASAIRDRFRALDDRVLGDLLRSASA